VSKPAVLSTRDLLLIASSVFLSLLLIAGNNYLLAKRQPRYGIVDIVEIYKEKESELALVALKKGATDQDQEQMRGIAQKFGRDLQAALEQLPRDCDCILLNRGAVVAGGSIPDYTAALKARLGAKP